MTDRPNHDVPQRILALRGKFLRTDAHCRFEQLFDDLLSRRRAEIEAGIVEEARGIALIGASGSGKSTAVRQLLARHESLVLSNPETARADVISLAVPTPATAKFVGMTTLEALGLQLRRDRTAQTIWTMVKDHLRERQTLFLHYDEAQDLSLHQTPKELTSIVNTLKSLLQNPDWPVGLILSGTPELSSIINHDPQLARRIYPVEIPRLSAAIDSDPVTGLIVKYADAAGLEASPGVLTRDFSARLIHAADREFGLLVEMTIGAIEEAMKGRRTALEIGDFTWMFRRRSGCIDGLNPFVVDDFERIEPRRLLAGVTGGDVR